MTTRGVFTIVANDGKADKLVMATPLLNQRMKDIMCARMKANLSDVNPTLSDIERTHILFVNAHFKPYAAIGFEYSKVRPQSGNSQLGAGVTFSIPQFGDFFHDMVAHVRLSAATAGSLLAPAQAGVGVGGAFPADGDDGAGTALGAATVSYSLIDAQGAPITVGDNVQSLVRYCEYPGERIFSSIKFEVNNNPLDEYDSQAQVMCRNFEISEEKLVGYKRLMGQEVARDGYKGIAYGQGVDSDPNGTAAHLNFTIPLTAEPNDGAGAATTYDRTGNFDISRQAISVVNGPQTPKLTQPALDLWIPLKFWCNKDVRLSVPSVSIPFGQRFISMEMVAPELLIHEVPNIFVLQTITAAGQAAGLAPESIATATTYKVNPYGSPVAIGNNITGGNIERMELYVNNIFMSPEVHDVFIKRIGFSLIRVFRKHRNRVNQSSNDEQLLSQLKWPIEYMYVCLKPAYNTSAANPQFWRDWHRCTRVLDVVQPALSADGTTSSEAPSQAVTYEVPMRSVDSLSITAHEITVFDNYNAEFFHSYQPYHFGGANIRPSKDEGALFVNFALVPGIYQPSGHFNLSRAREFYVRWNTTYIDSATPADILVTAIALNFLLITDGTAVLRYST